MSVSARTVVVGVFDTRQRAEDAVTALRQAGFSAEQIGFVMRDEREEHAEGQVAETPEADAQDGTAAGILAGGTIGTILGAVAAGLIPGVGPIIAAGMLASLLGGAVLGATTGGIIGAMNGLGIPADDARYYQTEFESGRAIVTVHAHDRYDDARAILRRFGAYDVENQTPEPVTGP